MLSQLSNSSKQNTSYTDLAGPIFRNIIVPDFEEEVKDVAQWRHYWRKISNCFEGIAHILLGVASILSFSAGFFNNIYLTYAAACGNTICLAMLRFSAYANNESIERNMILTRLLNMIGISPLPDPPEKNSDV